MSFFYFTTRWRLEGSIFQTIDIPSLLSCPKENEEGHEIFSNIANLFVDIIKNADEFDVVLRRAVNCADQRCDYFRSLHTEESRRLSEHDRLLSFVRL